MLQATYQRYVLDFKQPSGTSRGVLRQKESWFLFLREGNRIGIGECGILKGLSIDDSDTYEEKLQWVCDHIDRGEEKLWQELTDYPSVQFGIEMAFRSLYARDTFELFPSPFVSDEAPIPINGLVWMGDKDFMRRQISEKIEEGFDCIKIKIGAINFEEELELLRYIRSEYDAETIEIRVDANGGFDPKEALDKLEKLAQYKLHSIEQPIAPGQTEAMATLCKKSPIAIALDEELIGVKEKSRKEKVLAAIRPQYIILKPSLIGGFRGTQEWIDSATSHNCGWWVTSALESNIGLNAISQFTFTLQSTMPQGLGTGSLYTNNIASPLVVRNGTLIYDQGLSWETNSLHI